MTTWRLAERLRIAVIGLPLSLWAVGCEKEPRHPEQQQTVIIDAGRRVEVDAAEELPDAALDAQARTPMAQVALPPGRNCDTGRWCAPAAQATQRASSRSQAFLDCPTALHMKRSGFELSLKIDKARTQARRAAAGGAPDLCCYDYTSTCRRQPVKGRALLDRGAALMAALQGPLPDDARARTWAERGLAEHASITAFARAAVELTAAGAPQALVRATRRAGSDEIAHTRGCFALASSYANATVAPGELATPAARLEGVAGIARDTFLEGCVHETLAVPLAMGWLASAPALERPLLERIIREEIRHAELAWRTVAWAVATGGDDARGALVDAARVGRSESAGHPGWDTLVEPTLALLVS